MDFFSAKVSTGSGELLTALTLETQGVDAVEKIARMLKSYDDLRWEFGEIVRGLRKYNQAQFNLKGNGRYVPLSERYKEWKEKNFPGRSIMVLTGRLRDSIAKTGSLGTQSAGPDEIVEVTKDRMTYGTKVPYAAAHQYGYEPRNLPARPILFWDAGRLRLVDRVLEEGIKRREAGAK